MAVFSSSHADQNVLVDSLLFFLSFSLLPGLEIAAAVAAPAATTTAAAAAATTRYIVIEIVHRNYSPSHTDT